MPKILFVEDERLGVNTYCKRLERNGCICDLAYDLSEALSKLSKEKYDLLSLDIMFATGENSRYNIRPQTAGLELLKLIRIGKVPGCDPAINVIILTAHANEDIETQVRELGVCDYLKKPVPYKEVMKVLENLLIKA